MFDSDDDTSSVSSSSTMQSERVLNPGMDEVHVLKDSMLDQSLDALYEKRFAFFSFLKCPFFASVLDVKVLIFNLDYFSF